MGNEKRKAKKEKRQRGGGPAPRWIVDDLDLQNYAGALLNFHDWCASRGIGFRSGVMQAIDLFRGAREQ